MEFLKISEQRPTASDFFDPMGFEKCCRESVSSKEGVNWNERPRGVTCFVERERRREGETTDLGGRPRKAGRPGGWAPGRGSRVRTARYSYTDQGAGIRPVGVVKGKLVRWPARLALWLRASAYSGSYEMHVQDAAGR